MEGNRFVSRMMFLVGDVGVGGSWFLVVQLAGCGPEEKAEGFQLEVPGRRCSSDCGTKKASGWMTQVQLRWELYR